MSIHYTGNLRQRQHGDLFMGRITYRAGIDHPEMGQGEVRQRTLHGFGDVRRFVERFGGAAGQRATQGQNSALAALGRSAVPALFISISAVRAER